jgi:hypothetical protein
MKLKFISLSANYATARLRDFCRKISRQFCFIPRPEF